MSCTSFSELSLCEPILRALNEEGYQTPTAVQAQSIPDLLCGRDLLGTAQTGTGKTAAFALPILQLLSAGARGRIRALVLSPTRELAVQTAESFRRYGRHLPLKTAVILGGVAEHQQLRELHKRPDIVVATPGRLLDLVRRREVDLRGVEKLVLDEADRMLDMGFLPDVTRIISALPTARQTMLFSATLPREIADLVDNLLKTPVQVEVTPCASVSGNIAQKVMFVADADKRALLEHVLSDREIKRVLVFTRTKHRANRLAEQLSKSGINSEAIHSNKSQNARQRTLNAFSNGKIRVLVATDIVARGIDVEGISHVINFELPRDAESYVHRIGRTARAGADGIALSLCGHEELALLKQIERLIRTPLEAEESHPYHREMHRPPFGERAPRARSFGPTRRRGASRFVARSGREFRSA